MFLDVRTKESGSSLRIKVDCEKKIENFPEEITGWEIFITSSFRCFNVLISNEQTVNVFVSKY